jgi:hypothetical protein
MIGRYKQWTKKEDNKLRYFFEKHIQYYGARWHGSLHNRIMRDLKKWGYERSEQAVGRRCFRLGLKAYKMKKGEDVYKCVDCGKAYIAFKRYAERKKNKKKYCSDCANKHRHDWDKKHKKQIKDYLKEYHLANRNKRLDQQKKRRAKNV